MSPTSLFPFSIYSSLFWSQPQKSCVQMLFICLLCPFPPEHPTWNVFSVYQSASIYLWKKSIKYQPNARSFSGEEKYLWSAGIVRSLNSCCVLCLRLGLIRDTNRHDDLSAFQELTVWVRMQSQEIKALAKTKLWEIWIMQRLSKKRESSVD